MAVKLKKLICSPCDSLCGIKIFSLIQIVAASLLIPYLLTDIIFATQEYGKIQDAKETVDQAIFISFLWLLTILGVIEAAMGMILFIGVTTDKTGFLRCWIAVTGISTAVIILYAISRTTQSDPLTPGIAMVFSAVKFFMIYVIDRHVCDLRRNRREWSKPPVTLED